MASSTVDLLRPAAACPPATKRLHGSLSAAVEKVDGGVTVWGITVGSNCQIALPVFGTLFLAVGVVLTGTVPPLRWPRKTSSNPTGAGTAHAP